MVGLAGVVYILENDGLREGWFKVGCSTRSGQARAGDLNADANTGTLGAYRCLYERRTVDCGTAELEVFAALSAHRRGKWGQEFFHVELELAKSTIERICAEVDQSLRPAPSAPTTPPASKPIDVPAVPSPPPTMVQHASETPVKASGLQLRWIVGMVVVASVLWWNSGQRTNALPAPARQVAPVSQAPQVSLGKSEVADPQGPSSVVPIVPHNSQGQSAMAKQSPKPSAANASLAEPSLAMRAPSGYGVQPAPATRDIDLSSLNPAERRSIESACNRDRVFHGPAAYNRCLTGQLVSLQSAPRNVDLSTLNPAEQRSIESACNRDRLFHGPAAYNRCLIGQLVSLQSAPRNVDLSTLNPAERRSIESACNRDRVFHGPAAYNRCLTGQLRQLGVVSR